MRQYLVLITKFAGANLEYIMVRNNDKLQINNCYKNVEQEKSC